jgi:hypothetical protein
MVLSTIFDEMPLIDVSSKSLLFESATQEIGG